MQTGLLYFANILGSAAGAILTGFVLTNYLTLVQIALVLVIAGITLGMVSFNAVPSERQALQNDAQRIALLLQLARDEAIALEHTHHLRHGRVRRMHQFADFILR